MFTIDELILMFKLGVFIVLELVAAILLLKKGWLAPLVILSIVYLLIFAYYSYIIIQTYNFSIYNNLGDIGFTLISFLSCITSFVLIIIETHKRNKELAGIKEGVQNTVQKAVGDALRKKAEYDRLHPKTNESDETDEADEADEEKQHVTKKPKEEVGKYTESNAARIRRTAQTQNKIRTEEQVLKENILSRKNAS
jgi:hypothetical protein